MMNLNKKYRRQFAGNALMEYALPAVLVVISGGIIAYTMGAGGINSLIGGWMAAATGSANPMGGVMITKTDAGHQVGAMGSGNGMQLQGSASGGSGSGGSYYPAGSYTGSTGNLPGIGGSDGQDLFDAVMNSGNIQDLALAMEGNPNADALQGLVRQLAGTEHAAGMGIWDADVVRDGGIGQIGRNESSIRMQLAASLMEYARNPGYYQALYGSDVAGVILQAGNQALQAADDSNFSGQYREAALGRVTALLNASDQHNASVSGAERAMLAAMTESDLLLVSSILGALEVPPDQWSLPMIYAALTGNVDALLMDPDIAAQMALAQQCSNPGACERTQSSTESPLQRSLDGKHKAETLRLRIDEMRNDRVLLDARIAAAQAADNTDLVTQLQADRTLLNRGIGDLEDARRAAEGAILGQ